MIDFNFVDGNLLVAGINVLNTYANMRWTTKLHSIQVSGELLRTLKDTSEAKDDVIREKNEHIDLLEKKIQLLEVKFQRSTVE